MLLLDYTLHMAIFQLSKPLFSFLCNCFLNQFPCFIPKAFIRSYSYSVLILFSAIPTHSLVHVFFVDITSFISLFYHHVSPLLILPHVLPHTTSYAQKPVLKTKPQI